MNIYFYSATNSECDRNCHYLTCNRRCLAMLNDLPKIPDLKTLPEGSRFNTPSAMELRSGDILILYAEKKEDMENLLKNKDFFEPFRIILIAGQEDLVLCGAHYSLAPRYTTILGTDMEELGSVLQRMTAGNIKDSKTLLNTQLERNYV